MLFCAPPAPGLGIHPGEDPWGRRFGPDYYPDMAKVAYTWLADGWRGTLDGIQGDEEWKRFAFWLVRNSVTLIQIVFFAFMGMFHVTWLLLQ